MVAADHPAAHLIRIRKFPSIQRTKYHGHPHIQFQVRLAVLESAACNLLIFVRQQGHPCGVGGAHGRQEAPTSQDKWLTPELTVLRPPPRP